MSQHDYLTLDYQLPERHYKEEKKITGLNNNLYKN